jgi:hypothetical protein
MQKTIELPEFPVAGGCQCGAIRYQLLARPLGVYRCHCKDCQRFSSGAYAMSMPLRRADLRPTQGETVTYRRRADSGREQLMHACAACGTKLWNEPLSSPGLLVLKPGTLDDAAWAVPVGNIWVASKLPWIDVADDEPAFPGQPPTREPLYKAWDSRVID